MKLFVIFAFVLLLPFTAVAGTYTITTTSAQDSALQYAVDRHNAANDTSHTIAQYLQKIITDATPSYDRERRKEKLGDALVEQWPSFTAAKKTAICTQLEVSPCPQ